MFNSNEIHRYADINLNHITARDAELCEIFMENDSRKKYVPQMSKHEQGFIIEIDYENDIEETIKNLKKQEFSDLFCNIYQSAAKEKISLIYLNPDGGIHEFPFLTMNDLQPGDQVYWKDPDQNKCSRIYNIKNITYLSEEIVRIEDIDGSSIECFQNELS